MLLVGWGTFGGKILAVRIVNEPKVGAMAQNRKDKPEVKASKAGSLYVDLEEVIQSKSGRQTIRDMSRLSRQAKGKNGENKDTRERNR
jgi:hypothetical protein